MQEKKIIIDWNTINYKVFSCLKPKNTFLILHWWWWKSDSWIKVWNILEKFWYNSIIPDLPWFWKTKLTRIFTLEDYASTLEQFYKKLDLKDFILLWHSNWWAISIILSNKVWNDISELILNNSAWIRNDKKRNFKRFFFTILTKIVKKVFPSINIKCRKLFYKLIWWQDYLSSEKIPFLKETYKNIVSSDLQEYMKTIKIKTSIIWWQKDTYTPLSDWKKINSLIQNSSFNVLNNQKHWIHIQNPELLVKTILKNINI